MTDDLVTPENLTKEMLHPLFDAAFMEPSWDSDDDLVVKDDIRCFVLPSKSKDAIRLMALFGFRSDATEAQRSECVSKINGQYIIVRASSRKNDTLMLDHYIFVKGGVTKKNIVLATKRFLSIAHDAANEHGSDLIA